MGQHNVNSRSAVNETSTKEARAIHDRVLVLDSHIHFEPEDLTGERNYTQRLPTQFNLPNMTDGGLDALFFVIYVGQTREGQNPDALKAAGYQRAYQAAGKNSTPCTDLPVRSHRSELK